MSRTIRFALFALSGAFAVCGCQALSWPMSLTSSSSNRVAAGNQAPEIEGRDADGQPFRLSDYRGRVVLLSFWHNT